MSEHTEAFWRGKFGDDYNTRNEGMVESNARFFARILFMMDDVKSVLELGCGTGQNLQALHALEPTLQLTGIDINKEACEIAAKRQVAEIYNATLRESILGAPRGERRYNLVFTKGVLIHQPPEDLPDVYDRIVSASSHYILLAEYYNPKPMDIEYRGQHGVLWKRDFAGELMDRHPTVKLIDTGFAYHRDKYPQDDITWFLMEKT